MASLLPLRAGRIRTHALHGHHRPISGRWLAASLSAFVAVAVTLFAVMWDRSPAESATAPQRSGEDSASTQMAPGLGTGPIAAFTFTEASGPFSLMFDAAGSSGAGREIAEYEWDFGDGHVGYGPTVSHQYGAGGDYTVRLSVSDNRGRRGSTVTDVSLSRTLRIVSAEMRSASVYAVTVESEFHKGSERELEVTLAITSASGSEPLSVLERRVTALADGEIETRVTFDLEAENVPRFDERVQIETKVRVRETLADGRATPVQSTSSITSLPLPVIITHGIMGDLAPLQYDSFGPGMPDLADHLARDGYSVGGNYPTVDLLVYPSLHPGGAEHLAWKYMRPAVDRLLQRTHAAKVDIVAHSMGGIVARVYVETLRGNDNVRRLVTLGTPHEGAAKAHSALAGYGSHEPADTPGATLISLAVRQRPEYQPLLNDDSFMQTMADVGVTSTVQLLPDYPYYTERRADGFPIGGPGWPTDPGMDLQGGQDELLGPNKLLQSLNSRGFANGVEYFQVYMDHIPTRTEIFRTDNGDDSWRQHTAMTPGDGTVPTRSLLLDDYPDLNGQLWKCDTDGTAHKLMFMEPEVREQVRLILVAPVGEQATGCVR